jgi:hypothetical protein
MRTAHGKARELGRLTASECPPTDELRAATPGDTVAPDRAPDGRFKPGNRAARAKRVRPGSRGALVELERQGDPAARAAIAYGRKYASHRRAELARAHGELSAGVGAMVESAGELLSAGRYWGARGVAEGSADHARLAATLLAGARQAERDAWALATLEAASRPKPDFRDRLPWARPLPAPGPKPAVDTPPEAAIEPALTEPAPVDATPTAEPAPVHVDATPTAEPPRFRFAFSKDTP